MIYNGGIREVISMDLSILWASTHTAVSVYPHTHIFYQLIFCKKSGGYISIGNALYTAQENNVYLAKPGASHSIDQCGRMQILEVKFNAFGKLAEHINRLPDCFSPQDITLSEMLLDRVAAEEENRTAYFDDAARCALHLFFIEAIRQYGVTAQPKASSHSTVKGSDAVKENGDILILQLKDYIDAHLHEDLSLEVLAGRVHFNKTYFVQRFKSLWGVPPMKYVNNLRCQKAKQLLADTELSVSDISTQTGFQSPHYFSAVFKKYTGMSPNEFRKQEREREE